MSGTLTSHAPAFSTGDSNWNSALGNLAGALFPDPSRQAQAYYYGTQARNNLIQGDNATSEANAAIALRDALAHPGVVSPPLTYAPGHVAGGPPVIQTPANTPGLGAVVGADNGGGAPVCPVSMISRALFRASAAPAPSGRKEGAPTQRRSAVLDSFRRPM